MTIFAVLAGTGSLGTGIVYSQTARIAKSAPKFSQYLSMELFFGMDRPTGGQVTEEEWQKIVADAVTPSFPNGLTVDDALGQYLDGKILIREKSKHLILIYPRKYKTASSRKIEVIRLA